MVLYLYFWFSVGNRLLPQNSIICITLVVAHNLLDCLEAHNRVYVGGDFIDLPIASQLVFSKPVVDILPIETSYSLDFLLTMWEIMGLWRRPFILLLPSLHLHPSAGRFWGGVSFLQMQILSIYLLTYNICNWVVLALWGYYNPIPYMCVP